MKIRLDQLLVKKGLAPSRTKAHDMIEAGEVSVAGSVVFESSHKIEEATEIKIASEGETLKFVSRAGLKLEAALTHSKIKVKGLRCLDIGQSTGGFTDVLLQGGVKEVWGLDVGHGQLHDSIRTHKKVKFFENLDVREAAKHPGLKGKKFDLVVADLSFISLEKVVSEIYHFLKPKGEALLLVKPQFELERKALNKQGIVKESKRIAEVEERLRASLVASKFLVRDFFAAGVKGKDGNQEYFFSVQKK